MEKIEETSLSAPADRDPEKVYKPKGQIKPLEDKELSDAYDELNNNTFTYKFKKIERKYSDPQVNGQLIGLHSFIPSKGAVPDKDGIYGMVKFRGSFANEQEASERAEYIIGNVDSYHKIFHSFIGRPFPLTESSDFSAETSEVDLSTKTTKIVSDDIKKQKAAEKKEIEEVKEREKELLEESSREELDPFEEYITLRVKKAQLTWTYIETQKKMDQMKTGIIKSRKEIKETDEKEPEFY